MTSVGDRHRGNAEGALIVGGRPVSVEVRLGEGADRAPVQHTAWMLLNILCRLAGAVSKIRLVCPAGIRVVRRLSPLIKGQEILLESLLTGIRSIGSEEDGFVGLETGRTTDQPCEVVISVGFEFSEDATFCAVGSGLCGGLFSRPIAAPVEDSDLTIGPYIAACLAAGEVFRQVRLLNYVPERQFFLTASDYSHGADPKWTDLEVYRDLGPVLLVGVGAVGNALLHSLYPLEIAGTLRIADWDAAGVDRTNLGRYTLFGVKSIGKQKASAAAVVLGDARFRVIAHDGGFEHFFALNERPELVLSAVDTNEARHALQEQYAPLIISAATHNVRAEVLRCGPPGVGACLACFNPLKAHQRTEQDIRELLGERQELISDLCARLNLERDEVERWIRDGKCSQTGERLVDALRIDDGSIPIFAVGFVSALAGTLLAAELLKTIGAKDGPLDAGVNRAVFQFQAPNAATNRAHFYPRDEHCSCCSSQNPGTGIWNRRYGRLMEGRVERQGVSPR